MNRTKDFMIINKIRNGYKPDQNDIEHYAKCYL